MIHIWHMFLYIWLISMLNAGKQTIHGFHGIRQLKRRAVAETLAFLAVRKVRGSHGMLVFLKEGR